MTKWLPILMSRRRVNQLLSLIFLISLILSLPAGTAAGFSTATTGFTFHAMESGRCLLQDEFDRLDQFELTAPQLRYPTRTIQVYLPPDYYTSNKKYPVIYLHDGSLLFNPDSRDCLYDETLDRLFEEGKTDGIIAVGILLTESLGRSTAPGSILTCMIGSFRKGGGNGKAVRATTILISL